MTNIAQHPKGGGPAPAHTYKVSLIRFAAQHLTSRPDCFLIIQYLCKLQLWFLEQICPELCLNDGSTTAVRSQDC